MDGHATTPVDPRVVEAMLPYFTERFGNASSRTHVFGWEADQAVALARKQVARLIGARGRDVVFTSGGTEANNLALRGVARRYGAGGSRIVTVVTEHPAVLDPCRRLEREGLEVVYVPVARDGLVAMDRLHEAVTDRTILVSVMAANNEIGVLQPLNEIARIAHARGALLHTDAVQAAGKVPFDVDETGVDLATLSAHKLYGPKGIGGLYVRRRGPRVELDPLLDGGGQEEGRRPGTLNVPAIVGFGAACEICRLERAGEATRTAALRDRLWRGLAERLDGLHLNGSLAERLPNNLNVSVEGVDGRALLLALSGVAVSSGSACASASQEPSHVLRALGRAEALASASLRFGLGRFNTQAEVDRVVAHVASVVTGLRTASGELTVTGPARSAQETAAAADSSVQ